MTIVFGIDAVPANYKARIRRFIEFYFGDAENPMPFGGRTAEIQALDDWLADPAAPRNVLLTAPAASGKSALIVHWIAKLDRQAWAVVFVPISIRYETNRPDVFFGAFAAALAGVRGVRLAVPAGDPAQFYRDTVVELLDAWPDDAPACLVVIDGLDEATGWQLDTSVLPSRPRSKLRIVVSAREMAHCDADGWEQRIGWKLGRARVQRMALKGLRRHAVDDLLREVALVGTVEFRAELGEALFHLTDGDPLLLQLYVGDLLDQQKRGEPIDAVALRKAEPGFSTFFAGWMDQQRKLWEADKRDFDDELVKASLAILACAAGPLMHVDLEGLVPVVLSEKRIVDADALRPIQRFMVGDGVAHGYAYAHPKFGIYVREEWLLHGPWIATAERAFLEWGARVVGEVNNGKLAPQKVPPYLLNFYFLHLKQAAASLQDWRALAQDGWRRAWDQVDDGAAGFARDVLEVLRHAREAALHDETATAAVGVLARCSLILASIRSRGSRVPGSLLAAAVRTGVMTLRTAANLARARFEPEDRSSALCLLAEQAAGEARVGLYEEALAAANTIDEPGKRFKAQLAARAGLAPNPVQQLLSPADLQALLMPTSQSDLDRLADCLPFIGADDSERACAAGLRCAATWLATDTDFSTARSISAWIGQIGQHLPGELAGLALDLIVKIAYRNAGSPECQLIDRLPQERLPDVIDMAFPYLYSVALSKPETLGKVARRLDPAARAEVLARQLAIFSNVQSISQGDPVPAPTAGYAAGGALPSSPALVTVLSASSSKARLYTLILMLPFVSVEDAKTALKEIFRSMREDADPEIEASKLQAHQEECRQALLHVVPDVLVEDLCELLLSSDAQADTLLALLPRLSAQGVERVVADRRMSRSDELGRFVADTDAHRLLPAPAVRAVVDARMGIADGCDLVKFEAALLDDLPQERDDIYRSALDRFTDHLLHLGGSWEAALKALAPALTEVDVCTIVKAAPGRMVACLEALVGHLPEAALPIALSALAGLEPPDRAQGLLWLAQDFAERAEIADELAAAVTASMVHYSWEALALQALRAMSPVQRSSVDECSTPGDLDKNASLRALLFEAEPDPVRCRRYLDKLLEVMTPESVVPGPTGTAPPLTGFAAATCIEKSAARIRAASNEGWTAYAHRLLGVANAIDPSEPRARALIALILCGKLDADDARDAQRSALQAVAATEDPAKRARLLAKGTKALPAPERNAQREALVDSLASIETSSDRIGVLEPLLRHNPDDRVVRAFRIALIGEIGTFAPDLAREFKNDVEEVVGKVLDWVQTVGSEEDSVDLTLFVAQWQKLAPAERRPLLIQALTIGAFVERQGLLELLAAIVKPLSAVGGAPLLRDALASARDVKRWYP